MAQYNLDARVGKLQELEARGVIRPEHLAELNSYRQKGLVKGQPTPSAETVDKSTYTDALDRKQTAIKNLRLYDSVEGAIDRFNPGQAKGMLYRMFNDDESGDILDTVGGALGVPLRATRLMPKQDVDDYRRIVKARAERLGVRSQEQKGTQAKNDEVQFKLADISPLSSREVNRETISSARRESVDNLQRAELEARWISKYGSIAAPSKNGMSFGQALQLMSKNYQDQKRRRLAPPSTRGRGTPDIDLNGNPIR